MINIEQAVIFAGGKGERLLPLTKNTPKPLVKIDQHPFLYHLIDSLKSQSNIKEVLLLTGYLTNKFIEFKSKYEKKLGIKIIIDEAPLHFETLYRLKNVKDKLSEKFLLLYGDNIWDGHLQEHNKLSDEFELITTAYLIKNDSNERGNIFKTGNKYFYDKNRFKSYKYLDFGYMLTTKESVEKLFHIEKENVSFSSAAFKFLDFSIVETHIRHQGIGTIEKLELTKKYLSNKKVILFDRDGVLNEKPEKADYVKSPNEFIWKKNVLKTLENLYSKGFKFFIVSNQPGISRKKMIEKDLNDINKLIHKDARENNFKFEEIVYCKHGWNDGCFCRKPSPGMFIYLQEKYNLRFSQHYYFGDDDRDFEVSQLIYSKYIDMKSQNFSSILKINDL